MSNWWNRTLEWLGLAEDPEQGSTGTPAGILPTRRQTDVSAERALTLSTVYRGIQIHVTAVCQLSLGVERGGQLLPETPGLVQKPDIDDSRSAFLEATVVSLYVDGNAFWLTTRAPAGSSRAGQVVNLRVLNPHEVKVVVDRDAFGIDHISYSYRGREYNRRDMRHLQMLRVPGLHRGLGPIQAAQIEVRGALDARDYGAMWLSDSNMPDGVLTTDQVLAPGDADRYKNVWYGRNPDGTLKETESTRALTERLRVMGQGLTYSPLLLKPSDVQFLETQQFSTVQMARLIGAPATIMLVAVEGSSDTYSNVEQEWIGYVRFGLMKSLREIEEAFTELLPNGQTARFNVDALLRTDTKTRYEAHGLALSGGWMTRDEVRRIENLPDLTAEQVAQIEASRPTAPTTKETNNAHA